MPICFGRPKFNVSLLNELHCSKGKARRRGRELPGGSSSSLLDVEESRRSRICLASSDGATDPPTRKITLRDGNVSRNQSPHRNGCSRSSARDRIQREPISTSVAQDRQRTRSRNRAFFAGRSGVATRFLLECYRRRLARSDNQEDSKGEAGCRWGGKGSRSDKRGGNSRLPRSCLSFVFDRTEAWTCDYSDAHGRSHRGNAIAIADVDLAERGISGAGNIRSLRYSF